MNPMNPTSQDEVLATQQGEVVVPNAMMFIQSIKGAPASVLLALAISGQFMSHKELQLWTRCGKDQVTFALQSLVRLGWVAARTFRGPWILVRPLTLPSMGEAGGANASTESVAGESPASPAAGTAPAGARRRELVDLMARSGIREPTASELAELPHMSPDYIRAHLEGARLNGLGLGAAIAGMRFGAPAPEAPSTADREAEVHEKVRRFLHRS